MPPPGLIRAGPDPGVRTGPLLPLKEIIVIGPATKSQAALDWCVEARKKLKLTTVLRRDPAQVVDRANTVKSQLDTLIAKLEKAGADTGPYRSLEQEFYVIAERVKNLGQTEATTQLQMEAQRLGELAARIAVASADDGKAKTKAEGALAKAKMGLEARQVEFKAQQEDLMLRSQSELRQLQAIKFADKSALTRQIKDASDLIALDPPDHAGAVDLLSRCTSMLEAERTAAETRQKEELKNVGQKAHYETKVRKIQEVLTELRGKPGTERFVIDLEGALKLGASALALPKGSPLETQRYADGYDAITALVPSTKEVRNKALKASAKTVRFDDKDTELVKARDDARAALLALTEPDRLADNDGVSDHELTLIDAMARCGSSDTRAQGLSDLRDLTAALKTERGLLHAAFTTCTEGLKKAEQARTSLLYAATESERQALQEPFATLRLARTLTAALDFDSANSLLEKLLVSLEKFEADSDHTPDKLQKRWEGQADVLEKTRSDLIALKARKDIGTRKAYIERLVENLDKAVEDAGKNWGQAIATLDAIEKTVASEIERLDECAAFAKVDGGKKLIQQVADARNAAQVAFEALRTRLGKEPDSIGTVEGLRATLTEQSREWAERAASATNTATLDAAAAIEAFEALRKTFETATASPAQVQRTLADGRRKVVLKDWETRVTEVQSLLDALRLRNAEAAFPLAERFAGVRKEALEAADFSAPDGCLDKLSDLKTELTTLGAAQDTALADAQRAAALKYKDAATGIQGLRAEAKKSLKQRHRDRFEPFFKGLEEELTDLRAMVTSTSLKSAQGASAEIQKLLGRIDRLKQEVVSRPEAEGDRSEVAETLLGQDDPDEGFGIASLFEETVQPNFRLVMDAVALIQSAMKSDELGECLPVHQFRMKEEFKQLRDETGEMEPSEAFAALKAFHVRVMKAIAQAKDAKVKRDNFAISFREVQSQYVKLGGLDITSLRGRLPKVLRKSPTAYLDALDQRLRAAQTMNTEPQKEDRALSTLMTIRGDIMKVLDNGDSLVAQEKQAQAAEFQLEKESVRWDTLVKDFENFDLHRAREALKQPGSDASQAADLDRMLSQARKTFKDTGNFIAAVALLDNAKQYAARVRAHPQGLKAAARDELPKVRNHWKAAVQAFNDSVVKLVATIGTTIAAAGPPAEPDKARELDEAVKKSTALLTGLKTLFNADAMDGPIAVMTSKASVADRRAAREMAMREINRYKAVLRNDPVLVKLVQREQPFGTVDFYGINAALRDLDLNVQRAV